MKTGKKILIAVVVLLGILILAGFFFLRRIASQSLPDYNEDVRLEGIADEVIVYRDAFAVPHIFASNEEDLYLATGYIMAQDRLWQMDLMRRVTTGRLAEIFGEDLVETDLLMRALRIPEKSRVVLEIADERMVAAVKAFADGINRFIMSHRKKLPPEFILLNYSPEPWTPEHSANLIGYMAWDLAYAWNMEVLLAKIAGKLGDDEKKFRELLPDWSHQRTAVYPFFALKSPGSESLPDLRLYSQKLRALGLEVFSASNNWAVSGEKSETGKPLFANDMHLGLFAPGVWYQMRQAVAGRLNVTGVGLPGAPFVVAGHNDRIAWGMTNVMVDDLDFYREKTNPANPNEYEFMGEWRAMDIRRERIAVKGGKFIEKELRFTHRGPIVSDFQKIKDEAVSMRWIGNEESNELRSVYLLNRAGNWEEFKDAIRSFRGLSQNIIYADMDGNIGLYCAAGIPLRKGDGMIIRPGETDEYDWKGFVPFEELPHSYNPPNGYVSSANNKTANDDYPYYISYLFYPPERIDRIREMLEEKGRLSTDDFKRILGDFKSKLVERVRDDILVELKSSADLTPLERESLSRLESWDGILTRESAAATIFEKFFLVFLGNLMKDELGEELFGEYLGAGPKIFAPVFIHNILGNKISAWCDDVKTADVNETFTDIVRRSFKETVAGLREELGPDPSRWEWGRIHTLTLKHPLGGVRILATLFRLNRGPYAVGGSFHTVCPYSYSFSNPFAADNGASQRHIYSVADWDASLSIIPTGTSGIPAGRHYCDQTKLYLENSYYNDYFSREAVENNAKYRMKITAK